mgnify:CR=1 FL=1
MTDNPEFEKHEQMIINTLYRANRPLTPNKISEMTGMAWQTVDKYLKRLHRRDYVNKDDSGKGTQYWLRTE